MECEKWRQLSSTVLVNPVDASLAELLRSVPLPTASLFPKKKDIANDGFVKSRFPYSVHASTKPVLSEPSTLRQAQGERFFRMS